MRILDRYIFKSVLSLFLVCLLTFFCLYIIIDIFSHLDEILKQKVDVSILLQYYLSYLPIIFVQVTPIACLLATLYTFGTLNRNNEIIVMRSSGLSIFQITKTAVIFGVILSALVFWVNDKLVTQSTSLTEKIKEQMETGARKNKDKKSEVLTNLSMYGLKNRLYFINKFYPDKNTMEGIVILEHDNKQNITKKIVATRGVYEDGFWKFYQSMTYKYNENGQAIEDPQYSNEEIMIIPEKPGEFLNQRQRSEFMTIAQLDEYLWKLSKSGATTVIRNLKVDLYQRFAAPLTIIVSIFLGIPFSLRMKKRATGLSSVGLSIIVGFFYYVLNAVGLALGKAGILMPILAVSLSHMLGLLTALYLIKNLP